MNDFLYYLEIFIIIGIVFVQTKVFTTVYKKIKCYKLLLSEVGQISIETISIPKVEMNSMSTKELLEKLDEYKEEIREKADHSIQEQDYLKDKVEEYILLGYSAKESISKAESSWEELVEEKSSRVNLSVISCSEETTDDVSKGIINSINTYLLINKTSAADFNLIRDIVERKIVSIEDEINTSIPVPLYLGLMGTFLGIVLGLFNISLLNSSSLTMNGDAISVLLNGVKIAMIASFMGLGYTLLNSGWLFKDAKVCCDSQRNLFYTLLQTELLPILSLEDATNMVTMQRNLQKFNEEFGNNISKLQTQVNKNFASIISQKEVLEKLEKLDFRKLTQANVTIFQELSKQVESFEKFGDYLDNINGYIGNTISLTDKINDLLSRTDNFNSLAERIENNIDTSGEFMRFIKGNIQELEIRKDFIDKVMTGIDKTLQEGLNATMDHVKINIKEIEKLITETDVSLSNVVELLGEKINSSKIFEELEKVVLEIKKPSNNTESCLAPLLTEIRTEIKNLKPVYASSKGSIEARGDYRSEELTMTLEKLNTTLIHLTNNNGKHKWQIINYYQ